MSDPGWIAALVATMTAQTASAFLSRLIPTIAPPLIENIGFTPAFVGHVVAVGALGSMTFLLVGNSLIPRAGPVRTLQIGLLLGIAGCVLLLVPAAAATVAASWLIGLGYGPATPAGSEILQRHAPERHRNLIFSVKQAGVPLGGVLAGLTLPPLAVAFDWRYTVAFAVIATLITIAVLEPLRPGLDRSVVRAVDSRAGRSFIAGLEIRRTLTILFGSAELTRLALAGACFAIGQGAWFAYLVTYLVADLGFGLIAAGSAFSLMQALGVFGRIAFGWLSDRLGSALWTLRIIALASAATSAAIAWLPADGTQAAVLAISALGGLTVTSWNGIQLAEIARASPRGAIGQTTAAATLVIFIGYAAGPVGFAVVLALTESYRAAFLGVAALSLLALTALRRGEGGETVTAR